MLMSHYSLERILEFLRIDHEPSPTKDGVPPAYWPASGSLRVEGLKARYADGIATFTQHLSSNRLTRELARFPIRPARHNF